MSTQRAPGRLSEAGRQWLTCALDPFHDSKLSVSGLPDAECGRTVCQLKQNQFQLTAPAGTVGTWDAVVFNTRLDSNITAYLGKMLEWNYTRNIADPATYLSYASKSVMSICPSVAGIGLGTLNAFTWTSSNPGRAFFPSTGFTAPDYAGYVSPNIGSATSVRTSGARYRVIGMGWEIVNTTPAISAGGTATCVRVPSRTETINGRVLKDVGVSAFSAATSVADSSADKPVATIDFPPAFLGDALEQGAKSWQAADGAYVVNQLDLNDCKMTATTSRPVCVMADRDIAAANSVSYGAFQYNCYGTLTDVYDSAQNCVFPTEEGIQTHFNASDACAVYLTGLPLATTLTVTLRVFVEIEPRSNDDALRALAPLAGTSPCIDLRALSHYQAACRNFPPAVKVGDNESGDWWELCKDLLQYAAPVVADYFGVGNEYQLAKNLYDRATGARAQAVPQTQFTPAVTVVAPASKTVAVRNLPTNQKKKKRKNQK